MRIAFRKVPARDNTVRLVAETIIGRPSQEAAAKARDMPILNLDLCGCPPCEAHEAVLWLAETLFVKVTALEAQVASLEARA